MSGLAWWRGGILLVALNLTVAFGLMARPSPVRASATAVSAVWYHGVNQPALQTCLAHHQNCQVTVPGLAHCMKTHRRCDAAEAASLSMSGKLTRPVKPGTRLLTRNQALKQAGANNAVVKTVTAILTTYGALHRKDPALAAATSVVVNRTRPVWLVTLTFVKPVQINAYKPSGAPSIMATRIQVVLDAATGKMTDWGANDVAPLHP